MCGNLPGWILHLTHLTFRVQSTHHTTTHSIPKALAKAYQKTPTRLSNAYPARLPVTDLALKQLSECSHRIFTPS